MATQMLMPSLSPTMEEGTIAKWHVKIGDKIKQDTLLCSVETDKTTMDYSSLDEGFLRAILIPEGGLAKVNDLIALLTDSADEPFEDELKTILAAQSAAAAPVAPAESATPVAAPAPVAAPVASAPAAVSFQTPSFSAPAAPQQFAVPAAAPVQVKASPLAKKIAAEKGIDLTQVKGTGPGGRILVADLAAPRPKVEVDLDASPKSSAKPTKVETPKVGSMAPVADTKDQALSTMQKVVGKRLTESYQGAPAFFVTMKIDVDKANKLRAELNQVPGYKISLNDLVIKAVAMNLRRFPLVNAYFMGESIRLNGNIDISVAVAIEGGLITPIVKDADRKPLGIISAEMKDLAARAKKGTLQPAEFQGGTFTISNLGMFGVSSFTSIINPPQSAILAVAGTEEVLYRAASGEILSKNQMTVTLTSDHRVINGAVAAEFVNGLKEILENPTMMML